MCFPSPIGFVSSAEIEAIRAGHIRRAQQATDRYFQSEQAEQNRQAWLDAIKNRPKPRPAASKCVHCGASEKVKRRSGEVICAYCRSGC